MHKGMGGGSEAFGDEKRVKSKGKKVLCKSSAKASLMTSWIAQQRILKDLFFLHYKGKDGCNYFSWQDVKLGCTKKKTIQGKPRNIKAMKARKKAYWVVSMFLLIMLFLLVFVLINVVRVNFFGFK